MIDAQIYATGSEQRPNMCALLSNSHDLTRKVPTLLHQLHP